MRCRAGAPVSTIAPARSAFVPFAQQPTVWNQTCAPSPQKQTTSSCQAQVPPKPLIVRAPGSASGSRERWRTQASIGLSCPEGFDKRSAVSVTALLLCRRRTRRIIQPPPVTNPVARRDPIVSLNAPCPMASQGNVDTHIAMSFRSSTRCHPAWVGAGQPGRVRTPDGIVGQFRTGWVLCQG